MKKKLFALTAIGTMASIPVLASEPSGTANSAVTSAMTTVANDMIATGNSVIPIALTVVGLAMVVIFGVRMFTRVSKAK